MTDRDPRLIETPNGPIPTDPPQGESQDPEVIVVGEDDDQ